MCHTPFVTCWTAKHRSRFRTVAIIVWTALPRGAPPISRRGLQGPGGRLRGPAVRRRRGSKRSRASGRGGKPIVAPRRIGRGGSNTPPPSRKRWPAAAGAGPGEAGEGGGERENRSGAASSALTIRPVSGAWTENAKTEPGGGGCERDRGRRGLPCASSVRAARRMEAGQELVKAAMCSASRPAVTVRVRCRSAAARPCQ